MNKIILTKSSEIFLKNELINLKIKKKKILEELEKSRKLGDLSENSEYITVKKLKYNIENKIKNLENILSSYEVINEEKIINKEKIFFSAYVELENLENNKKKTIRIVSDEELNINNNYISINSPLAKVLIGKNKNEIINFKKFNKNIKYKINSIKYN